MLQLGQNLSLLDDPGPAVRANRLLGELEHPFLLELRMDDAEDLRLATRRKSADDQVFADRGGERLIIAREMLVVAEVGRGSRARIARPTGRFPGSCRVWLIGMRRRRLDRGRE